MRLRLLTLTIAVVLAALVPASACAQTPSSKPAQPPASADAAPPEKPHPGIKNIFWQPNQLQQGSPAFFTVELDRLARRVTGTWIKKQITFFKPTRPATAEPPRHTATKAVGTNVWYALAGDDLETQPGSYDLAVTAVLANGHIVHQTKTIQIAAADFKSGAVNVPENFVQPDDAAKKHIAADDALKTRAFAHITPRPLWSGDFLKPVNGPSTPSFGESRLLNEERTSTHRGTDFPVKEGTPVLAANSGTVVLAREMFYEGNCVIIDHGQRLFTIYMHLSKINVSTGDRLAKGAHIGLSGATGRVTGPHMHFGLRWNGAYLDPVQLLSLTLPKTGAQITTVKKPIRRKPHA